MHSIKPISNSRDLLLTRCLIGSALAIEFRTPGHPATAAVASAVAALHLHLLLSTSAMERFLSVRPPPPSDVILAPKSINLKADDTKEVVEFKLQGKNYI
jgi:hypothetical protein